ncbi:metabotropic glutamate receptor 3-like isoform X2 [Bolinopsis microptera]|uniref:metabotropic glutamate receptor 3-like isoform X2 n=1 Tax=Bolinopsis microptera TaxID=2820187 RepID=UPI0030798387
MRIILIIIEIIRLSCGMNVLGSVGLAAPLQCDLCQQKEDHTTESELNLLHHYTNIPVYRKDGDVILGGLFPLQRIENRTGIIRYKNVALAEMMAWTIDKVNADENVLPGITLGYEIRDTLNNAPFASVQALELAAKNVFGVVGPGSSMVAIHLASLLGSLSFPMVAYSSTSDLLSDSNRFRMFARTVPSDKYQCKAMADIIHHYKWSFVSIIYSPELYGREGADELTHLLEKKNTFVDKFHPLIESKITDQDHLDQLLKGIVTKPPNRNTSPASVIVLFATRDYAEKVIKSAVRLQADGIRFDNVTWIASESWGARPNIISHFMKANIGYFIGMKIKTFPVTDFLDHFRNLTPETTENPWFKHYYKEEYCKGELENCQHKEYQQDLYDEAVLLAVEAFAHTLHDIIFKEDIEQGITERNSSELDQCVVAAKPISNTTDLYFLRNSAIGKCIFQELITGVTRTRTRKELRFNDTTGDFEAMFTYLTVKHSQLEDSTSDAVEDALHDIGYWDMTGLYVDDYDTVPFGNSPVPVSKCSVDCTPGQWKRTLEKKTCWECINCDDYYFSNTTNSLKCERCERGMETNDEKTNCTEIPRTFLDYKHPAAIVLIIISLIGMILTAMTIVIFTKFRDTPLVKASSRELCLVLLAGIFLGFISTFFSIGEPSSPVCLMQLMTGVLFGTLTIVPVFLKTFRIYILFFQSIKSAGGPPKYLQPMWQGMVCMMLVLLQMIILMFVIIWHPLKRQEEFPNDRTVLLVCSGVHSQDTVIALAVPVGYIAFFSILSLILSYKVRKLPSNFHEAKYICLALTIAMIVMVAFGSSYFVTAGIWQKFLIVIAAQTIALSFLILIFYKKVLIIVFYPERNKICFAKDAMKNLEMSRTEKRKSFLESQHCHMCNQPLHAKPGAEAGLISAANMLSGIPKVAEKDKVVIDKELQTQTTECNIASTLESGSAL